MNAQNVPAVGAIAAFRWRAAGRPQLGGCPRTGPDHPHRAHTKITFTFARSSIAHRGTRTERNDND